MTIEEKMQNFCVNILRLRKSHGLTQKEMAQILGIGVRALSTIERGTVPKRLGSSVLIRAGEYFQIQTEDLFLNIVE